MISAFLIYSASLISQGLARPGMKHIPVNIHCAVSIDGKFKENWNVDAILDFLSPYFVEAKTRDGKKKVVFNLGMSARENGEVEITIADQTKSVGASDTKATFAQPLASVSFNIKKLTTPVTVGAYGSYAGSEPELKVACQKAK
ncbi:MAG: hypothetical protein JWQ35_516 [Bacteriovoracaceae bacterium]|nr:hypothetical protein [Bacteriovoracaceae bacterium]